MSKFSDSLNNYNRSMLVMASIAMLGVGIALAASNQVLWSALAFILFVVMAVAFLFSLPFRRRSR